MSWFSATSTRCQELTTFQKVPTSTRIEPSSSWKVLASGAGYTPVLFSESGVGVVVLVVWIVSSIQVIQPLQSGVDCVAELVVLVNKHSLPILTLHTIRTWAVPCGKPGLCGGGATESSAFQRWHLREDPAPAGVVCEGRVEM